MKRREFGLTKKPPGATFAEEKRTVSVTENIQAVKLGNGKNGDNDFHLILGDGATYSKGPCFTAEVTGVPRSGSDKQAFREVRGELLSILPKNLTFSGRYGKPTPPIHVQVVAPVYFDADHTAGSIGPAGAAPNSVWEIHPVQSIKLVP
jgi:hypothetical protein